MFSDHGTNLLADLVLAGFAGLLIASLIRWLRHPIYTPGQRIIYFYGYVMARVLWRARVEGELPVAPGQGAIIICNHRGPYDPAFIQLAAHRVVHWMVAREYCEHPALGWFFRTVRSIPVSRAGIDTAATKMAIRYAQQGGLVGMFPEGRINTTDQLLLPGRPGAALIALRATVPVIPCFIEGSPCHDSLLITMLSPAKVRLVFGRPIEVPACYQAKPPREVYQQLTLDFLAAIARLGGDPHFQPRLAGRHWKP